jgi:hypothetical protein
VTIRTLMKPLRFPSTSDSAPGADECYAG